jgi:hypothetical protein
VYECIGYRFVQAVELEEPLVFPVLPLCNLTCIVYECMSTVYECMSTVYECMSTVYDLTCIVYECMSIVYECMSTVYECSV